MHDEPFQPFMDAPETPGVVHPDTSPEAQLVAHLVQSALSQHTESGITLSTMRTVRVIDGEEMETRFVINVPDGKAVDLGNALDMEGTLRKVMGLFGKALDTVGSTLVRERQHTEVLFSDRTLEERIYAMGVFPSGDPGEAEGFFEGPPFTGEVEHVVDMRSGIKDTSTPVAYGAYPLVQGEATEAPPEETIQEMSPADMATNEAAIDAAHSARCAEAAALTPEEHVAKLLADHQAFINTPGKPVA